jgi:hypothetical protein
MPLSRASLLFDERLDAPFLRLASTDAEISRALKVVLREAAKWNKLPNGWTEDSVKKFWGSMTGENKHKITKCMKEMEGKVDNTGAFCGGLASHLGLRAASETTGLETLPVREALALAVLMKTEDPTKRAAGFAHSELGLYGHDNEFVQALVKRKAVAGPDLTVTAKGAQIYAQNKNTWELMKGWGDGWAARAAGSALTQAWGPTIPEQGE